MVRIAPIKLQYSPKTLWFDPQDLAIRKGDAVVVTTARGTEFGHATDDVFDASDADVKKLKTELKPVERLATSDDEEKAREMQKRSDEALPIFKEMAAEANEDMHPVSVEFLFDGDKAVFYFEAEDRIDFRELVRKLASKFHVRIDMRQIGVRDEARIIGGIGHCGQELCCKRLGGEFCPVSIRMAKEQDLSLNPQKISGVCGRLMCCLRYEFDAYKDFKDRAPKMNSMIDTPEGRAKVIDLNVPREIITLLMPDDKRVKIPLNEMTATEKGARPNKVSKQVFDTYANQNLLSALDALTLPSFGDTSIFSGTDTLAKSSRDGSRRQGSGSQAKESPRKPRRRTKVGQDGEASTEKGNGTEQVKQGQQKRRAGQRSKKQGSSPTKREGDQQGKGQSKRRSGQKQSQQKQGQSPQKQGQAKQPQAKKQQATQGQSGQGPRPGQRSSGLRKNQSQPRGDAAQKNTPPQSGNETGGVRRTRRRSHKTGSSDTGGTGAAE